MASWKYQQQAIAALRDDPVSGIGRTDSSGQSTAFPLTSIKPTAIISSMNDKIASKKEPSSEGALGRTGEADQELASLAKALAHPARVRILKILAERTNCVCGDIVSQLPLAQSTVSEHLRIMKAAGLLVGEVDGPRVCYCIDVSVLDRFRSLVQELPQPVDLSKQPYSEVN